MSAAGSQYAFVIQTRDDLDRSWSWVSDYGTTDNLVAGRGVEDDVPGTPQDFGRATFDAYLDRLAATSPAAVEYFLFDDDRDTEWRILVWDVPATGYDQMSTVPPRGDRARLQYPLALATDGVEPQSTGPGRERSSGSFRLASNVIFDMSVTYITCALFFGKASSLTCHLTRVHGVRD